MTGGELRAIWIKRMRLGPMDPSSSAALVAGKGIVGNTNQGGKRQVTIIEEEVWEGLMRESGASISASARRANLMVRGINLSDSPGRTLIVGNCRLLIHGETRPCERMDQALPGLRDRMSAVRWSGGVFAEVLDDGVINVGDAVKWENDFERSTQ